MLAPLLLAVALGQTPRPRVYVIDDTSCVPGHGTKVAGLLESAAHGSIDLRPLFIQARRDDCPEAEDLIQALAQVKRSLDSLPDSAGAAVVNISLQISPMKSLATKPDSGLLSALRGLRKKAVVVLAAGNDGMLLRSRGWLAEFDNVLLVGALDRAGGYLKKGGSGTRHGAAIDIYAPGEGTSFAAPAVSGALASMLRLNPGLSPAQLAAALKQAARKKVMPGGEPILVLDAGKLTSSE